MCELKNYVQQVLQWEYPLEYFVWVEDMKKKPVQINIRPLIHLLE